MLTVRFHSEPKRSDFGIKNLAHTALITATVAAALFGVPLDASAVPSFARQTGFPCVACHTAFPQLTAFGRQFKANGYVISAHATKLPPLAMMIEGGPGYTHTTEGQDTSTLPSDSHSNDNVKVNQISLFYAGRLLGPYSDMILPEKVADVVNHMGVMGQGTWDGVADQFSIDNTEFRMANQSAVRGHQLIYGAFVNNNPGMEDLWNSTPVWGFPFTGSGYAPAPAASPLIAGGFGQQVVGAGAYAWLDAHLYAELGVYGTASSSAQRTLGVDPSGEAEIDGAAPNWRLAYEQQFGASMIEVGTFGLDADTFPQRIENSGHDHQTDVGLDAQYQWDLGRHDITVMGSSIFEHASWDASKVLGFTSSSHDDLWDTAITATYLFDKTYGLDFQFFTINGDDDQLLYGSRTGSPDSNGIVVQADYLPFNKMGGPSFWPMSNLKVSLQFTHYNRFDGSSSNFDGAGRSAQDNDTLFLELWWAL
jgi:hypothetical protein